MGGHECAWLSRACSVCIWHLLVWLASSLQLVWIENHSTTSGTQAAAGNKLTCAVDFYPRAL
eukprot:XP_001690378.1 predicted protein [Chlamydomonas reinhardtii]